MLSRLLPLVLILPLASGQSLFGPATAHPKAGDPAPDLVFTQVLSAPSPGSWSQANLSGQVTVLGFFPLTSRNPTTVAAWNERATQFAGRHVQFVWITSEDQRTLIPALASHPIKGWVLYDPENSTARAFGLDMPVHVYIGPNRRIVGFQEGIIPDEQTLNAVLDNRVVLTRPTPSTITSFRENNLVALDSVPARMPNANDFRPHIAPSYTVHITPSTRSISEGHSNNSADDYWVLQGFTLKEAIEEIYGVTSPRIELPLSLDTAKRYDFELSLPQPAQREEMKERFSQALQDHFHLTVDRQLRPTKVYILSREPGHKPPPLEERETGLGGSRSASVGYGVPGNFEASVEAARRPQSLDNIFSVADEGTMDDLCRDLEGTLDRPVVNETHLDGSYRIRAYTPVGSKVSFLTALREQTGLVITPGQRNISFLKFKMADVRPTDVGTAQKERTF